MHELLDKRLPMIAILRGLEPEQAVAVGEALLSAGFEAIEVPLNSPNPTASIKALVEAFGDRALVGAGTVLRPGDVNGLASIGAKLVVSPNCNPEVIRRSRELGMVSLPGVLTPTEMFAAIDAGASGLKFFPAELVPPHGVKAVRAVLPPACPIYLVGGINPQNMREYLKAGATGFAMGGAVFKPGMSIPEIEAAASEAIKAFKAASTALR